MNPSISRGQVWLIDPDFVEGNDQAGRRPMLVVSVNPLNQSAARRSIVIPISSRLRTGIPTHVPVKPPEGGLRDPGALLCEQVRSIGHSRFKVHLGAVTPRLMGEVEAVLHKLLFPPSFQPGPLRLP